MKNIKLLFAVLALVFTVSSNISAQTLTSLNGEKVNISNQTGKIVVLAIGASWLPLSKDQAGFTNKLAKKFAGTAGISNEVLLDFVLNRIKNVFIIINNLFV